ncbi:MAG TPA: hypothetical protein DDY91_15770 [Planctomycetaceae bacterium]|nr:hypothetical protein [Planctomycetaceae bacterium]
MLGELLLLAIFRLYHDSGKRLDSRYFVLLESGSNHAPERLLARAGADISEPGFWQKGLDVLGDMVTKAEQLAGEVFPGKH